MDPTTFPRVVILTGGDDNQPARHLVAALVRAGAPLAAVVVDPPRGGQPRFPEPPLLQKYQIFLRHGMIRYAARKFVLGLRRRRLAGRPVAEPPGLDALCAQHGIELVRPGNVNEPAGLAALRERAPGVLVMMGCRILQVSALATARLALNFHTGLLPWYRGGDTIYWALKNGEPERVGFSIHEGVVVLDAGRVVYEEAVPPRPGDLIEDIFNRCIERATPRWIELLDRYGREGRLEGRELDLTRGNVYKTVDWWEHARVENDWLRRGGR